MSSPGTTPVRPASSEGGQPAFDCDRCPLCEAPITLTLELTEDGPEWLGECVTCNTIVEAL